MAYSAIAATQIETGDPVTADLWTKVKDDFDNHETRIASLEVAVQTFEPIKFTIQGAASLYAPQTAILHHRIFQNITLTSGRVFVIDAGSAGTLDCDIQYKRGAGAFASIFSTRPSVAFGAGSYALSTNGVISITALLAADILRLDIVTGQTGNYEFHVYLTWVPT